MTLEGLIEFIVNGILNVWTKDFTMNGEILGFLIAVFCLSCVIFVMIVSLWEIITKNHG